MAVKVKHSVSVQAQEQVSSGERFYQDSDVGGTIGSTIDFAPSAESFTLAENQACTSSSAIAIGTGYEFIGIRHKSGPAVTLSFDNGSTQHVTVPAGGALSLFVSTSANLKITGTTSAKSIVDYHKGT